MCDCIPGARERFTRVVWALVIGPSLADAAPPPFTGEGTVQVGSAGVRVHRRTAGSPPQASSQVDAIQMNHVGI